MPTPVHLPGARAAMTAFFWYLAVLVPIPVGWVLYAVVTGDGPPCSGVFGCTTGALRGVVFVLLVEPFYLFIASPSLLLPVGSRF
ncbi:hypothetical protein [Halosaccharopolyspora lacisalsi]|uniref:hypothetical protein n=1 Tax=Halosaccharopolyspora lacisalsi TaxID=1000566 RepID=UPI001C71DCEB|nr:hypothetical protein [Halosaccharopolyspora lacisalsi]